MSERETDSSTLTSSQAQNEITCVPEQRLGRLPAKASRKALMFSDFYKYGDIPKKTNFWRTKSPLPLRHFGNNQYGDCTRAKQAVAAMRMERLEQKRTITVTDAEIIRVYTEMSDRLYGGGDNGAYEDDALNEWRRPETTFTDTAGRPYTIDAYLRLNAFNHEEVRAALSMAKARGLAICLNLPIAFANILPPRDWDIPEGQAPTGPWMPGSWGGHSLNMHDFDETGFWLDHTWMLNPQRITYRAAAIYMDEVHIVLDSVNTWKKLARGPAGTLALKKVIEAVNDVSSYRIQ
jgi:hypothetical protein